MTKILESISVEVQCGAWVGMSPIIPVPIDPCRATATATIVSTVERGDLILVPIGWTTSVTHGQIEVFCPEHNERKTA